MVYINAIYIVLNYRRTLYTEIAYINYLISSLNISADKTLVSNFNILFAHLSAGGKPYYSSSLFLNRSIDLTNISL